MLLLGAQSAIADEVLVFAAASLKNALDDVAEDFTAETGHKITISYAGSGQLAQQILAGAPAGLFVSANTQWMDEVEKAGLLAENGRRNILGNRLVLIAHAPDAPQINAIRSDTDLAALLNGGKLAMALVNSVPAGQYGKAALDHLGLWDSVAEDVAQSDNVRSALALVSTGEAPLGIVYASDALADDNVTVIGEFPAASHPPIVYPAGLLAEADDTANRQLFDALTDEAAARVFARHGFTLPD